MSEQGTTKEVFNVGHGHVYPRTDGVKARCGGPGMCKECSSDLAHQQREQRPSKDQLAHWREITDGRYETLLASTAREMVDEIERLRTIAAVDERLDRVERELAKPASEPHVIKQIEHALQDNPAGISREMADYIRGCISDYRHALPPDDVRFALGLMGVETKPAPPPGDSWDANGSPVSGQ